MLKKILKWAGWGLLGIIGLAMTLFGLYAAFYGHRIHELRGMNLLVVPGTLFLATACASLKALLFTSSSH